MKSFSELAQSVKFGKSGRKTILLEQAEELQLIGRGRSAFVFRIKGSDKVLKVFFPPFGHIAGEESEIYRDLECMKLFPELHDYGENYLLIDLVEGDTLFS